MIPRYFLGYFLGLSVQMIPRYPKKLNQTKHFQYFQICPISNCPQICTPPCGGPVGSCSVGNWCCHHRHFQLLGGFFIGMFCLGSNLCYQKSCLFDHIRAPSKPPLKGKKRTCPSTRRNVRVVNIGIPMKHGKLNVNNGIITYYNGILPINWCSISQPSTL